MYLLIPLALIFLYNPSVVLLQIVDERKTYAEKKDEEVKLLERSVDDLGSDVVALENLVSCLLLFQC